MLDDGNGRPAADRELLARAAIRSWRDSLADLSGASGRPAAEAVYRDMRDHEDLIAAHPVVRALAAGGPARGGAGPGAVPGARAAAGEGPALDPDSAQRACVAAALAGRPVVAEGPAGAGRDQVVVNVIRALLEAGRTVLVAADEAAGPGPVRERLAAAGLAGYLRELPGAAAGRHAAPGTPGSASAGLPVAGANPGAVPAGAGGPVPGEVRRAAAALAAAWRPAAEGRSFRWREVIERGSLDDRLYQAASALEALGAMVRPNETLATVTGLTRPSDAEALVKLLGHLWAWPDGLPDEWLTVDSLDAVDAAVAQLAASLMAIAAREGQAAQASGVPWQAIPSLDALPASDTKALAALTPPAADVSSMTAGKINGLARVFSDGADMLDKRLGTLSGLASMLGLRPPASFHDAADLLTLARLAQEPDRPERAWLSIPGHQAASRAARALYDAHRVLATAEAEATAVFTPGVLQLDVDTLAERFASAHRGIGRLSGEYRADRKAVADVTRDGVDPATAQDHFGLAVAWKHAAQALAVTEGSYAGLLGSYYTGRSTDFDRLGRALGNAATAVRCARRQDLSQAADHLCRDAVPKPVITATAAEILQDLSAWQATLAPPPAVAPRPELMNAAMSEAIGWLRAHLAPLRAASEFTLRISEIAEKQLSYGEARQLVALREAADAAHAELTARDAVFKDLCGPLYAGLDTDLAALRSALEWARRLRTIITAGAGPLSPAHVRAAESAVPTARLGEASAAWRQASAALLAAFAPGRSRELAAELDDYSRGIEVLEALFNDAGGRDEWYAYQAARATLAAHGMDAVLERCIAERVPAARVPQLIEQALGGAGLPVRTGGEPGPAAGAGRPCLVATPLAVSQQLPAAAAFDAVVIDEAGRLTAAAAVGCVYRGSTLVLAGGSGDRPPAGQESLLELASRSGAFLTVRLR